MTGSRLLFRHVLKRPNCSSSLQYLFVTLQVWLPIPFLEGLV